MNPKNEFTLEEIMKHGHEIRKETLKDLKAKLLAKQWTCNSEDAITIDRKDFNKIFKEAI